jgi:hypothetical protein
MKSAAIIVVTALVVATVTAGVGWWRFGDAVQFANTDLTSHPQTHLGARVPHTGHGFADADEGL